MTCAPTFTYNDQVFRQLFPEFSDQTQFPPTILQMYWDTAGTIISNTIYGFLAANGGPMALNLMTAHLAKIGLQIANGETPAPVTGATIDKVSVTLQPPPSKSLFDYWLSATPYGLQLLAMLAVAGAAGLYVPGGPGRAGFTFSGANPQVGFYAGGPIGFRGC